MSVPFAFRLLALSASALLFSACHPSMHSAAGHLPAPSHTTAAQANSTAAPDQYLSVGPASKYYATAGALHGVEFSIWANGQPVTEVFTSGQNAPITKGLRGHANLLVVKWKRTKPGGTGSVRIHTGTHTVLTASVTPHSAATGEVSKTFIAPQMPVGRYH